MQRLTHVATYARTIGASVERIWENALDWEHLPWLHRSSFTRVTLLERGPDFWRARLAMRAPLARSTVLELRTERPRLAYVTRTLEGAGAGTEIRTQLEPACERRTRIAVAFHRHSSRSTRDRSHTRRASRVRSSTSTRGPGGSRQR